jgi:hypothetical protein
MFHESREVPERQRSAPVPATDKQAGHRLYSKTSQGFSYVFLARKCAEMKPRATP